MESHQNTELSAGIFGGLINELHGSGRLQVWSIIITLFGDCVVPRGGSIGTGSLQEILSQLRIGRNAVRTALSRLARDGWLLRQKQGRQSLYSLAPGGRTLFDSAARRIYAAAAPSWNGEFQFLISHAGNTAGNNRNRKYVEELGYGSPLPGLFVKPVADGRNLPSGTDFLVLNTAKIQTDDMGALVSSCWDLEPVSKLYQEFLASFEPLLAQMRNANSFADHDHLAARLLLIHQWRRIVLRDPGLPRELLPENWTGELAREVVKELYQLLLLKSERYLDIHCPVSEVKNNTFAGLLGSRFK